MIFSSPVFLYLFLPVILGVYYSSRERFGNLVLLFGSLVFYAWGETYYIWVILCSITANHYAGLAIAKYRGQPAARIVVGLAISFNLGLLTYFKYSAFFIRQINLLSDQFSISPVTFTPIHLPLGISFFTFQAVSYVLDVYRGDAREQQSLVKTALYLCLFPQLIAGPIVRYGQISDQIDRRTITLEGLAQGITRFIIGLGKKMIIANPMGAVSDQIFAIPSSELTAGLTWFGLICFSIQIYFDFSGYSDMAIGLGRLFGFSFPENFNYPYMATSTRDFWRRWHITLGTWFRDYLYYPLGGGRVGVVRKYFNLMLVAALCGLWHGASGNFVIWGLLHGLLMAIERIGLEDYLKKWPQLVSRVYFLFTLMVTRVFFNSSSVGYAGRFLIALFGFGNGIGIEYDVSLYYNTEIAVLLFAGILLSMPTGDRVTSWIALLAKRHRSVTPIASWLKVVALCVVLLLSLLNLASESYNPFIYFRF